VREKAIGIFVTSANAQTSWTGATGTNEFLTLMLDPFVNGRGYAPGSHWG
jgi:hypothetical protein